MMKPLNELSLSKIRREMVSFFERRGAKPLKATADDLISIEIDARLHVKSVKLHREIQSREKARLEKAIAKAVNDAIHEVLKQNTERLTRAVKKETNPARAKEMKGRSR